MRFITRLSISAVTLAVVASGCGGAASEPTFAAGDLEPIVQVRPLTPGWGWPQRRTSSRSFLRDDLRKYDTHPIQATLTRELEKAEFVESHESTWRDGAKKASSFASVFDSAAGAQSALAATRVFARRWQSEVEGAKVSDIAAAGLGDESWGIRQGLPGDDRESVTYDWRRDNLVLEVHVLCNLPCPSQLAAAAHVWAAALDAEAVRVGSAGAK